MITLRPYQNEAVAAIYSHLQEHDDNPCVVLPTAAGKTPVLATVCKDAVTRWGGRVLILAHVKELLEQAVDKLTAICPEVKVGVYSAGLKRRDTEAPVIVAGIQSIYKRACELDAFDLIVIDEAHMIPPDGDGMYRTFLDDAKVINPHLRVIGLTATPFRIKTGMICGPENVLNHVCYEIGVKELIVQGYLCPLITKASKVKIDTSELHVRAGEFISSEAEDLMDQDELVRAACKKIMAQSRDRKAVLIFATSVKHGQHIADVLRDEYSASVETVFGDTLSVFRDQTLTDFREGRIKYLVNVNVLTTGFDAPNIDCVALVRPTMSPGLYYQMVGRGFRLHPAKEDCLVLDFGGNVLRHGPVDAIRIDAQDDRGEGEAPAKECPQCQALVAAGYSTCPQCGFEFPPPDRKPHEAKAAHAPILSGQATTTDYRVQEVFFAVHSKRGADPDHPKTLRVEYRIGWREYQSEWICIEHDGWARQKAESWWNQRSNAPCPTTATEAVRLAEEGALAETLGVTVRHVEGEDFDRITGYELGDKPAWREPGWDDDADDVVPVSTWDDYDDEEIPF